MFSFAESRVMIVYQLTIILSLNIFLVQCIPLIPRTIDGSWDENMVDCAPGGRCWEWSHKKDLVAKPDYYEEDPSRVRNYQERDLPVVQSSVSDLRPANRIAKKDVFMSRGWGAGGMPFSVLYLNPHSPRANSHTGANEIEPVRVLPLESSATPRSPAKALSNRLAVRNGGSSHPRRPYSIIPQLFVSYGWGPLGK